MKSIRLTVFAGLLIGMLLVYYFAPSHNSKLISSLLSENLTTEAHSEHLRDVLSFLLASTQFESRWQINKPRQAGFLNIYVIRKGINADSRHPPGLQRLLNNCSYIGDNTIICDAGFLEDFLTSHGVQDGFSEPVRESHMKKDQNAFLLWILGHEVGHIINNDVPAHFQASDLDAMVASSSIDNKKELEADSFVVGRLTSDPESRIAVETMLMDVLNAEIRKKVGKVPTLGVGIIYDYSDRGFIEYARKGTHPEFVIRLTRMLEISSRSADDEGLRNLVQGFANHLREAPSN